MRLLRKLERVVKGPTLSQQLDQVQAQLAEKQQQLNAEKGKLTALQAVMEARERKIRDLEKDKGEALNDKMKLAFMFDIAQLKQEFAEDGTTVVREWFEINLPAEMGGAGNLAKRAEKALDDLMATV